MKFNRISKTLIISLIVIIALFICKICILGINVKDNYMTEIKITGSNVSIQEIAYKLMDKQLAHYKKWY